MGADGASAAWLLMQHAAADRAFPRECLDLMVAALESGEVSPSEVAYPTDRVLLAERQPQVYGTRVTRQGGEWQRAGG